MYAQSLILKLMGYLIRSPHRLSSMAALAPNCGIVITDLTAMVGDCMRSFVEIAKDALFPMWYWELAESDQRAA